LDLVRYNQQNCTEPWYPPGKSSVSTGKESMVRSWLSVISQALTSTRQAVLWQDSLLSLSFDRPPITPPITPTITSLDGLSYLEAMQAMCNIIVSQISTNTPTPDYTRTLEAVSKLECIQLRTSTRLHGRASITDRNQNDAFALHVSFVISCLCRPALRGNQSDSTLESRQKLIEKCHQNLIKCVSTFKKLHAFSILASRSWTVLHNGLSSALLLSLLDLGVKKEEVRKLQREVIEILSADCTERGNEVRLSTPHSRILDTLKKLYDVSAEDSESNSGQFQSSAVE